ncbi:Diacylglycerol kinase zeta [Exaiptasia diaphana]|nr:Diacylglycerol kinase zeta [Exaiptasia diaphana]
MKSNKENTLAVNSVEEEKRNPQENASKLTRSGAKSRSYKRAMATPKYEGEVASSSSPIEHKDDKSNGCDVCSDTCDWTDNACIGRHFWIDSDASANLCYLSDYECTKSGPRKKCTSCKIVVHTKCIEQLERINFRCKPTYREIQAKGLQDNSMRHHWVHRRKQDGKCEHCGKSFQHMLSFQNKDIISISCSWCKIAYHNKVECFSMRRIDELCELGVHANTIVPPSWVVKIPKKHGKSSSIKRNSFKKKSVKRKSTKERKPFVIKPSGTSQKKPLLVFINPKSGGNQGLKIMHKFQWLLNPRQVFDLSRGGPREGLELYRKVPNLRILACGGDGTVGWVLSELDRLKVNPLPAVAILPLGTGNDLSRVLNWGGGYADEPLSKILLHVEEGTVVHLDRWNLDVSPNDGGEKDNDSDVEDKLPLNVMNNYFSFGFDAEVCLGFHNWRESHPGKSSSRIKNLMLYGKASSTTFLQGKSKDFFKYTTLECDGVSLTDKLLEIKPLALLFLNISKYAGGTSPWGNPGRDEFLPQSNDDGLLEVVCFSSSSLAASRVGGHGERIAQCKSAVITTTKTIPMQVDGEPCRLASSRIRISRRNQVDMIEKTKRRNLGSSGSTDSSMPCPETIKVQIFCVEFKHYEKHCYNIAELRESGQ